MTLLTKISLTFPCADVSLPAVHTHHAIHFFSDAVNRPYFAHERIQR